MHRHSYHIRARGSLWSQIYLSAIVSSLNHFQLKFSSRLIESAYLRAWVHSVQLCSFKICVQCVSLGQLCSERCDTIIEINLVPIDWIVPAEFDSKFIFFLFFLFNRNNRNQSKLSKIGPLQRVFWLKKIYWLVHDQHGQHIEEIAQKKKKNRNQIKIVLLIYLGCMMYI